MINDRPFYTECKQCGCYFVKRDEGPLARGYCGDSCEYEASHPDERPENEPRGEAR